MPGGDVPVMSLSVVGDAPVEDSVQCPGQELSPHLHGSHHPTHPQ